MGDDASRRRLPMQPLVCDIRDPARRQMCTSQICLPFSRMHSGTPKNAAGTEMQLAVGPCPSASGRERPRTMSWTETGVPCLGACISPPPFEPINRPTLWPSRLCECPLLHNTSILHCPVANTVKRYALSAAQANVRRPPTMRPPDQRHREHNTARSRRVCRGCHSSPSAPRECWPLLSHLSPIPH